MVASSEKLLPGPAAVEAVTGDRPHYSTFFRWTQSGVKAPDGRRVKLAYLKAGARRLTTPTAVREFFAAAAAQDQQPAPHGSTPRQREAAIKRAEAELAKAGI